MFEKLTIQRRNQGGDSPVEIGRHRLARQAQYHDSGLLAGRVQKGIGEIKIERNKRSPLLKASYQQFGICRGLERLFGNRTNIVAGSDQRTAATFAQVLVELQLHARASSGMST